MDERIRLLLDMGMSAENARAVVVELDKLKASAKGAADELEPALQKVKGGMAGVGQATLQTGRVVQDFAQGGIPGILNNIEGLTMALGLGPGLAGVLTAVGVAAFLAGPKLKEFFGGMTEATDAVKKLNEQIKEQEERIKKAHEAYEKLANAPESIETESAKALQAFLAERPHAEEAKRAVAGGLDVTQARAALSQPQQQAMAQAEAQLFQAEAYRRDPSVVPVIGGDAFIAQRQAEAGAARAQIALLMQQGRQQGADAVLQQAQVAGPLGDAARARVFAAAQGRPGLAAGLAETTPDAIEAQRERRRLTEIDNKQAERRATADAQAWEKKRDEQNRQSEQLNDAAERNNEFWRDKQASDADRAKRDADRGLEQEAMGAGVSERDIRHERATGMAEQLMGRGADIVGQAFGPQAAMRAKNMLPAEIQATKQQTIERLERGELPFDAILAAFQEVIQAAERRDQATGRFIGQLNGMVGRMQSSPWPSGLQR